MNLSGVNNLEEGLFLQLSAVALGVATAPGGSLAGIPVGEQYHQLLQVASGADADCKSTLRSKKSIS